MGSNIGVEFLRKDNLLNNLDMLKVVSVRKLEEVVDYITPIGVPQNSPKAALKAERLYYDFNDRKVTFEPQDVALLLEILVMAC
jgi:hypothetical protein